MIQVTLEDLVGDEEVLFEPLSGAFSSAAIEAELNATAPCFRDPGIPGLFVLARDQATLDHYRRERDAHPQDPPPYTLLVMVEPTLVRVVPMAADGLVEASGRVLAFLMRTWPCRVINGHGNVVEVEATPPSPAGS